MEIYVFFSSLSWCFQHTNLIARRTLAASFSLFYACILSRWKKDKVVINMQKPVFQKFNTCSACVCEYSFQIILGCTMPPCPLQVDSTRNSKIIMIFTKHDFIQYVATFKFSKLHCDVTHHDAVTVMHNTHSKSHCLLHYTHQLRHDLDDTGTAYTKQIHQIHCAWITDDQVSEIHRYVVKKKKKKSNTKSCYK